MLHVYRGEARTSEPVTSLEDIVITARELCEQRTADEAARAAEQADAPNARPARPNAAAREDAQRDAARAEQEQAVTARPGNLGDRTVRPRRELAAVHRHNRPLLAAIAAKYNAMEFAMETVEIGVIATDDGMTWANTETRDTLGKTRDGWWLELQKYGAERLVLKRYRHIAAVWQPLYRTPLTDSRYARPVDVIIPTTTAAMNWPGTPPSTRSSGSPPWWTLTKCMPPWPGQPAAGAGLPAPPSHDYNYHHQLRQLKQQARELYCPAMNMVPPAPDDDADVPF